MRTSLPLRRFVLLIPVLLAACAEDPFVRPGTWHATGDNDHNLRQMVAVPADLEHGEGSTSSLGSTSAAAIGRMRTNKLKPLTSSSESFVVGGVSAAPQP